MCTVSWIRSDDGYELYFSRDEKRTRPTALAPQVWPANGRIILSPLDPYGGGTWITVNDAGLTVCVLNSGGSIPPPLAKSRGLIPHSLGAAGSAKEACRELERMCLDLFPPFTILAVDKEPKALCYRWSGLVLRQIRGTEDLNMITSSSLNQQMAERARQDGWLRRSSHENFHRSHEPAAGPWSVCVHREDVATVSLSRVRVSNSAIEFDYQTGSPCLDRPHQIAWLNRNQPHAISAPVLFNARQ
jgi:hypothetical protein